MLKKSRFFISVVLIFLLLFSTTVYAKPQPKYSFDDIQQFTWAVKAIEKMYAKGFIKGVGDKKFNPSKPVTHLEALVMILRAMGYEEQANKITDLPKEYKGPKLSWEKGFITLAYQKGILTYDELKKFNPNEKAKRYEIVKYLVRALGLENQAQQNMNKVLNYKDWDKIPKDAIGYMYVAVEKNLIKGDGEKLKPNDPVRRVEMAVLLERLDEKVQNNLNGRDVVATVYAIDNNIITVKVNGGLKTFNVLKNVPVYNENEYVGIDYLKAGYQIRLILDSKNNIIFVEVLNNKSEEVIPIELKDVKNPPEKVSSAVEAIKNKPAVKLVEENGIYYVIATRGMMRTGGYIVNIQKAQIIKTSKDTILEVEVKYIDPSPDAIVTQVITYPYDIKSFTYDGKITQISVKTDKNINVSVDIDLASDVK
ncbi:S-layer homology domain-containing protein [Thermoanaerobacter sp. RKWS2]|uniref:S-layer homology domain-containing protein n=1 Tax=Thermoanaerobacter sp. RKWS2 TaxID=2983842 RepID=UPI00224A82CC|nr:S-layer homology domain-containing protein [Thermoanaerobacter sp. RKWS2]UZQ83129.1 S-layer homology domain-containing protein [Thermoanaerobacter sp. RKWS2]